MSQQRVTPADVVFAIVGRPEVVGPICGLTPTVPYTWRRPAGTKRDAGDIPSARTMRRLLDHARAEGLPLTAEHLIYGCDAAELDRLLAAARPRPDIAAE